MNTTEVNQHLIGKSYEEVIGSIVVEEDNGACCGWANCEISGEPAEGIDRSILILKGVVLIERSDNDSDGQVNVLNFVFSSPEGNEVVLGYELSAGSDSGYSYGAFVRLVREGEELASASW